jgi:hypothetical protein
LHPLKGMRRGVREPIARVFQPLPAGRTSLDMPGSDGDSSCCRGRGHAGAIVRGDGLGVVGPGQKGPDLRSLFGRQRTKLQAASTCLEATEGGCIIELQIVDHTARDMGQVELPGLAEDIDFHLSGALARLEGGILYGHAVVAHIDKVPHDVETRSKGNEDGVFHRVTGEPPEVFTFLCRRGERHDDASDLRESTFIPVN